MTDLKNKTINDVLSDKKLKDEIKKEYITELKGFEKEGNKDPYNEGYTCTEIISEVEKETPLGLQALSSFVEIAIKLENGWEKLNDWEINQL